MIPEGFDTQPILLGPTLTLRPLQTFPEVWFHIGPTNIRLQKATLKLGAQYVENATLDLSAGPALWKVYRLIRSAWKANS